jgi:hypothetical protein
MCASVLRLLLSKRPRRHLDQLMFGSLAIGDGLVINMFGSPVIIVYLLVP